MSAISTSTIPASRTSVLAGQEFDLLVIGAGIYGATLACAAARAGLKVALVEKGDYGEGASANSLKILHGGLRYLQQMDVVRMKESIEARRYGLMALPYLAHPATFLAPAGSGLKRSRLAFGIAARLNDYISRDRNKGVPPTHQLMATSVLEPGQMREMLPGAEIPGRGGLMWSDGFVENTERFTLAFIMSAREAGAVTANYVRAVRIVQSGDTISGAEVRDEDSGEEFRIRARMTVNTAGCWIKDVMPGSAMDRAGIAFVRAYNIVVRKKWFGPYGVGLDSKSGSGTRRNFFFAPWREGTMIGTVYKPFDQSVDACRLTAEEIRDFVREVNQLYPAAGLGMEDVTFAHVGILPGKKNRRGETIPEPSGTTLIHDLKKTDGLNGFLAIQGVKYTTAEHWARHLLSIVMERLGRRYPAIDETPLYGAEKPATENDVLDAASTIGWNMKEDMAAWLASQYGARCREVMEYTRENSTWRNVVHSSNVPLAAVVHAVRKEDAKHLVDVIFRRTDLGTFAFPGDAALSDAAAVMARLLGWDEQRRNDEILRVRQHYERVGITLGLR